MANTLFTTAIPRHFRHVLPFTSHFICMLLVASNLFPSANALSTASLQKVAPRKTASSSDYENLDLIREQVHCYALPYGALGFISHILTYYCLITNAYGRRPLNPWREQEHGWRNLVIGIIQLIGSVVSSSLSVSRCAGIKELELLGVWMILTSIASTLAALLGSGKWMSKNRESNRGRKISWWLIAIVWLIGCLLGLIVSFGLAGKTSKAAPRVERVTFGFFITPGIFVGGFILLCKFYSENHKTFSEEERTAFAMGMGLWLWATLFVCSIFFVFMLFYMDWLLAAVTGNWVGVPRGLDKAGQAMYWTYFAFKRLALFTS